MAIPLRDPATGRSMSTHGMENTPTYSTWRTMLDRCKNPRSPSYVWYGAKGVQVCARWQQFENFLADMGAKPHGRSIDRYPDRKGNYEPGNCRWATNIEQHRNKSSNRLISHAGETLTVTEWAERFGLKRNALYARIKKGYSPPELFMKNIQSLAGRKEWQRRKADEQFKQS